MAIGWGNQEMHRQTGASTEQGMDAITAQQGARMVGRSMTSGGIGIASAVERHHTYLHQWQWITARILR